jgi:uncharacterized protein (TIGR03437 family)
MWVSSASLYSLCTGLSHVRTFTLLASFNGPARKTKRDIRLFDGIGASIDGKPTYVSYGSPTQVNVQAPEDSTAGHAAITATNCQATSSAVSLARRALAPGLLAPSNSS